MAVKTESDWKPVANHSPCLICGAKRKCASKLDINGNGVAKCTKQSAGASRSSRDSVSEYHIHKIRNGKPITLIEPPELPLDRLHEIYAYFLARLQILSESHRQNLLKRGLPPQKIEENKYRTLQLAAARSLAHELQRQFGDDIKSVPGIIIWDDDQPRINYSFAGTNPVSEILLIPVRNQIGRIVAIKQRIDDHRWQGGKYTWFSSSGKGGRKASQAIHCPKGTPTVCPTLRITEGELKADVSFALTGIPTISIPGVNSWRKAISTALELGAVEILVAFDADARTNPHVAAPMAELFRELKHHAGFSVSVEHWDASQGKGLDDLLASGGKPRVATGDDADRLIAEIVKSSGADKISTPAELPEIYCFLNEEKVIGSVLPELAKVQTIYQRGGALVHVVREAETCPGIVRQANAPTISFLPEIGLRTKLSAICVFKENSDDGPKAVRVPHWVTKAVHQLGEWPGVRRLESVVTYPVIRADGSIIEKRGYDSQTGLFVDIEEGEISVPESPSLDDVKQSVAKLKNLVCDFPFEKPEHFSGWLSLILTILSRFAFDGPSPLFVIDANTRGSGKSLLAELASIIVTGQDFARMANARDDEEIRKRITAIALRGDPIVLIDNVAGDLGSPSFDSALTSTSWSDRVLGQSEMTTLPLFTTWVATGNNISLAADTSRRVCHIRLLSPEERPEERTSFKNPNITSYTRSIRSELLSAALTILKGYFSAGCPVVEVKPWGSFEAWSTIVRQSVVWAGEVDPGNARDALILNSDSEIGGIFDLIRGWELADPTNEGLTVSRVLEMLEFNSEQFSKLKNALSELCGSGSGKLPSAKSIGRRLQGVRCRVAGEKCIDARENRTGTKVWFIRNANAGFAGFESSSENQHAQNQELQDRQLGDIF